MCYRDSQGARAFRIENVDIVKVQTSADETSRDLGTFGLCNISNQQDLGSSMPRLENLRLQEF